MEYHVAKNGEKSGPFSHEEIFRRLVAGELSGTDLGWHEGMGEWEPLSKLIPPPSPQAAPFVAAAPVFGNFSAQPAAMAVKSGTSGLAITSLVSGILGFVSLGVGSIVAIITGHLALSEIKKSIGAIGGKGMAVAGLILGYSFICLTVLAIIASLAVPAYAMVQQQGMQMKVMNNAKQIVLGLKQYAADHEGKYPPTLDTLFDEQILTDRRLLQFPPPLNVPGQGWDYRGAKLTDSSEGSAILLMSKHADRSKKKIIAHNDGSVEVRRE
jgi:type II secretory pathway pseudopilin PulG